MSNSFELIGRIGWMDMIYLDSGTAVTTINLGVKKDKNTYENFFIKFINSANSKNRTAEKLAENHKTGDYIRVKGSLSIDKFTPKNADKEIEKISLLGWGFKPVVFDEETKKFIDVEC